MNPTSLKKSPRHASLRGSQHVSSIGMLLIGVAVLIGPASGFTGDIDGTVLQGLAADVTVSTFPLLQQAVIDASTQTLIDLEADVVVSATLTVDAGDNIAIRGKGARRTLDGANSLRIFVNYGTLTLQNLKLWRGRGQALGEARGSSGGLQGGAVYSQFGVLNAINVAFHDNYCILPSSNHPEFRRNRKNGGALMLRGGEFVAIECEFKNNVVEDRGGAIYTDGSWRIWLNKCAFSGNSRITRGGAGSTPVNSPSDIHIYENDLDDNALTIRDTTFQAGNTITTITSKIGIKGWGNPYNLMNPNVMKTCASPSACYPESTCSNRPNSGNSWGVSCSCNAGPTTDIGGACLSCPAGRWLDTSDSSSTARCSACLGVNTYCPGGSSVAITVDFGHYSTPENVAITARTGQAPCSEAAGEYCGGGIRSSLPPGYFIDENEIRRSCLPGFFCINGAATNCTLGSYCPDRSESIRPCTAGFSCADPSTRTPCGNGAHCPEGSVAPRACPKGQSGVNADGFSACVDCSPGTYRASNETGMDDLECTPCPPGEVSPAGASECKPCESGTFESENLCEACPAGRHGATPGLWNDTCSGVCEPGTHAYRFSTKCTECEVGKFAPDYETENCAPCDDLKGLTSNIGASACACVAGKYRDAAGACVRCTEGMNCGKIGSTVASLDIRAGHWRANIATTDVFKCPAEDACQGGTNTTGCRKGNVGILCAICEGGYYRPKSYAPCERCGSQALAALSAFGIFIAMAVALVIFIMVNRHAPNGLLRPFIELVQKVSVMLLFAAPFPAALVAVGRVLTGLSFGIEAVSPKCSGFGSDFIVLFQYTILVLVLLVLAMVSPSIVAKYRHGWTWRETFVSKVASNSFRDVFVVILLLHPAVSGKTMEFFRCREIEGEWYLMADYSLKCYDARWYANLPFVLSVLVFFSAGTPAAIAYTLYKRAGTLYDEEDEVVPQPLDILYAIYRRGAYWYESVSMVFKLALWSTLVFFPHGAVLQLATALVVNVLQLCIHLTIMPMGGDDALLLNRMQGAALVLTTYINFGALSMNYLEVTQENALFKDDYETAESYDGQIAAISVIMELFTFGLFVCFGAVSAKKAFAMAQNTNKADLRSKIAAIPVLNRVLKVRGDDTSLAVVSNPVTTSQPSVKVEMVSQDSDSSQGQT